MSSSDVINLGCRLNIAEGERISDLLQAIDPQHRPVVINSCGVTAEAVSTSRASVRRAHRDNPDRPVMVTGCAAQIEPAMFATMPGVARVIGNGEKFAPEHYRPDAEPTASRIHVGDIMALVRTAPQMLPAFDQHARAFLDVQNGCDHRCTFCIIPYGRGPSRSVPIDHIVDAATAAVARGQQEVILTGVDLTSYGQDQPELPTLADLCAALLSRVTGLQRIRLGSIDVAEIDDALFALLTGEPRMMPHVHLSLQSGDDLILKRMKRRHRRADAVRMVARLKAARPDIAIGADLIAGFPTEDADAALNSQRLIADCDIVFAHIFPYSPRDGTPASRMPQLPRAEVKQRAAALRDVARHHQHRWLSRLVGTPQRLLVERDGMTGHIDSFARMRLGSPAPPGAVAGVWVTDAVDGILTGRVMT